MTIKRVLIIPPGVKKTPLPKANGHWRFPEAMGKGKVGFVYMIRDLILHKYYVGKKQYRKAGQINKGEESDWRYYKTSSRTMAATFAARPIEEFDFFVIEEYETKSGLSFAETWTLCQLEAPTTPMCYNTRIEKVAWAVREGITFRHKARLEEAMQWPD
jgi:hypothetical protein